MSAPRLYFFLKPLLQNDYKMVDFGNEVLINHLDARSARMLKKLAQVNDVTLSCIHLTLLNSFHSYEYGKNLSEREPAQAKHQDNSTSGRGARASYRKRFPPRFRPMGRFCEIRFRYLSSPTGREGEISRPPDHMRQIPFIHSAQLIDSSNCYKYRTVF